MRWALFISLAVNLLLVGAIVGVALGEMRHEKQRASAAVARAPNMRAILDALPPERAAEVQGKVAEAWRAAKEERKGSRQAREAVAGVVAAETYDRAAAGAAFARMRAADARVTERFHDVVADAMTSMTVEERRALLRQLATRRAGVMREGAGDLRTMLREMPAEERRALIREFMEERRAAAKAEGAPTEARGERLKALREELRRRRAEQAPAPSETPP
jgi:uncharacterized membrane protein